MDPLSEEEGGDQAPKEANPPIPSMEEEGVDISKGMGVRLVSRLPGHTYRRHYRACYIAIPLYICGFVVLGASFQNHLSVGGLIMGWGVAETAYV